MINFQKDTFTKSDVAKILSTPKKYITKYLETGTLKGYAEGGKVVILRMDLIDYLNFHVEFYLDLISYLDDEYSIEGNAQIGFCCDSVMPLTERDSIMQLDNSSEKEDTQENMKIPGDTIT